MSRITPTELFLIGLGISIVYLNEPLQTIAIGLLTICLLINLCRRTMK